MASDKALSAKISMVLGCQVCCVDGLLVKLKATDDTVVDLEKLGLKGVSHKFNFSGAFVELTLMVNDKNAQSVVSALSNCNNDLIRIDISSVMSLSLCVDLCNQLIKSNSACTLRDSNKGRAKYLCLATRCSILEPDDYDLEFDMFWDYEFVKDYGKDLIARVDVLPAEKAFVARATSSLRELRDKAKLFYSGTNNDHTRLTILARLLDYGLLVDDAWVLMIYWLHVHGRDQEMISCAKRLLIRMLQEK